MTRVRYRNAQQATDRWDAVFRALSAEPRRQLVLSLLDAPAEAKVPLPESTMNPDIPVEFDELLAELHHRHLPLLAEEQFVEWETDPMVAYRGARFDEMAVVMNTLRSEVQEMPDSLVVGCQHLEKARQRQLDDR